MKNVEWKMEDGWIELEQIRFIPKLAECDYAEIIFFVSFAIPIAIGITSFAVN